MPRIVELDPGKLGLQPTETGVEAAASAGRRLGAFYNQTGEALQRYGERGGQQIGSAIRDAGQAAVDYEDHREISHGAATFATLTDNLTNQWNDVAKNADPNDPSVAAKFRETVLEPSLEKFRDAFNTEKSQNWAESHVDQLRNHMFEKTASDMATLAGQAAKVNTAQTINTLSNTAFNDPTSLGFALKSFDTSVEGIVGSSPNLKGAAAAAIRSEISEKGREQIVKSAAIGYIQQNAQVPPWATDPQYSKYINGVELKQFQKAADAQTRANLYYDRQAETLKKQQADLQVHRDTNDLFSKSVTVDPNNPTRPMIAPDFIRNTLDIVRKNPDAPNAATVAKTYIDWAEHQQNLKDEVVRTDPATRTDLTTRMFSADKPTTEVDILRAEADRKLSHTDAAPLLALNKALSQEPLRDPVWHDTIAAVKGELILSGVGLPGKDIAGEANYAKWAQTFVPQYLAQKRAGTLPANALDVKDPTSLISQSMAPFKRTVADRMKDYVSVLGNLSDQNITGVKVENAPPFNPPKTWQYSASRDQYRDPATKKVYDRAGHEVK